MSAELELADDFASFDGLEAITLRSRDGQSEANIPRALRRAVRQREAQPSAGQYAAADVTWHFEAAESLAAPEVGGTIVDASGRLWRVLEAAHETLRQRWACLARELSLAAGLSELVTIQVAEWTKGDAGALTPVWSDWRVGLAARVQPEDAAIETTHARRDERRRFRIYLAEEQPLDSNHRIVRGGEIYHVLGYEKPERIDELFVVLAEQTAWPLGET